MQLCCIRAHHKFYNQREQQGPHENHILQYIIIAAVELCHLAKRQARWEHFQIHTYIRTLEHSQQQRATYLKCCDTHGDLTARTLAHLHTHTSILKQLAA